MPTSRSAPTIAVVGSANLDLAVPVARHPQPGETVLGGDHRRVAGGKGANQAVAGARLGARTAFIGCVGDDDVGRALLDGLEAEGIDVTGCRVLGGVPSGLALIVVAEGGENTIVVSPGANAHLEVAQVQVPLVADADAVLVQLEVPVEPAAAAVAAARGLVVCNPAPAAPLPAATLAAVDVLVPNRSELRVLTGAAREPTTFDEVVDLARTVEGPSAVVVTLGTDGAVVVAPDRIEHLAAHPVAAVDTTAAGDAFCGALTVACASGAGLTAAARYATAAAAITVTRHGAQPSLPTRADVDAHDPGASSAWRR